MNILITSAGQRVSLVRAFDYELKKIYPDGKVMTVDMNPGLSAACRISFRFFKASPVTDQRYISELLQICKDNHISMIVPTIDTELYVLSNHKERFWKEGILLVVPGNEFVRICRDKRMTNSFFKQRQIQVPELYDKQSPKFPVFIKPYDGSRSVDTFIIREKNELTSYHYTNDKLMFMEYIDRSIYDEYTVDMYYGRDNTVKCIVPRKRLAIRSGEVLKGLTVKNMIVSFLKERLNHIDGAMGCLTLQLFYNENQHKIIGIEINPRFGGGYPLSYRAGANYPGWLLREYFLNEKIEYFDNWEADLLMLRYDDEILVHDFKLKSQ